MSVTTLLFLALGLSMDAFAVSISNGICYECTSKQRFITALTFGVFQAAMPAIGYFAGRTFAAFVASVDHWLAFILLCFIGGKMLLEAIKELRANDETVPPSSKKKLTASALLLQSVATSIDALAVGISFAALNVNIVQAVLFIGIVTFVCCMLGGVLGRKFGMVLKQRAEIFGGAILIFIGVKIFIEHMFLT